jgi:hypothetical protein
MKPEMPTGLSPEKRNKKTVMEKKKNETKGQTSSSKPTHQNIPAYFKYIL